MGSRGGGRGGQPAERRRPGHRQAGARVCRDSGPASGLAGGLYPRGVEPPFDLEREKQEPTWGDPTYRRLPVNIRQEEVGASHLHLNLRDVLEDFNILLPLRHFQALAAEGRIGGLSKYAYSFMGYQGFPPDTRAWQNTVGPQVADELKAEGVHGVLLVPA